jgi:hypothetical protein
VSKSGGTKDAGKIINAKIVDTVFKIKAEKAKTIPGFIPLITNTRQAVRRLMI